MHEYDKSTKWLIEKHGDALLGLAGIGPVVTWQPLPAELVQPRQLPDGILEIQLPGADGKDLVVLEITTYAEKRVHEQITRDIAMIYLAKERLPETVVLVLRPKGKFRVQSRQSLRSRLKSTWLRTGWRVIELWNLTAQELFAADDVGLVPLVPLTDFTEPPETVLRKCRREIDKKAPEKEHANLLAITQVLAGLRYREQSFADILGGSQAMIESPVIKELEAKAIHGAIVSVLEGRFDTVPEEILAELKHARDKEKLMALAKLAGNCKDLKTFRKALKS